jgi:tetratricopeptide (TPR) repeat protein
VTITVSESVRQAQALVKSLDYPEAIELLTDAPRRAPDRRDARLLLGLAYFRSRQYSAAEVEFRRLVESDPMDAQSAYNLGLALQEMGRVETAAAAFESAVRARPDPRSDQRRAHLRPRRTRHRLVAGRRPLRPARPPRPLPDHRPQPSHRHRRARRPAGCTGGHRPP